MKNLAMGMKIALGFGILLFITAVLGGLGIFNMKRVEKNSTMLAHEYVPEVAVAVELRGAANRIMYEMRGYGFTQEMPFYEKAQQEFAAADRALQKASQLERDATHLKQLKGQLTIAEAAIGDYKELAAQTAAIVAKLSQTRAALDAAAAKYMKYAAAFLAGQNQKLAQDIEKRQKKIAAALELVELGTEIRVNNFKSQSTNDGDLIRKATKKMEEAEALIISLRRISARPRDISRFDQTQAALNGYKTAMESFWAEFRKGRRAQQAILRKTRASMDQHAAVFIENCNVYFDRQQKLLSRDVLERNTKITLVNDIMQLGNATRICAFKAQALRNPDQMERALGNFPKISEKITKLQAITRLVEDRKRIEEVKAAAHAYETGMTAFLAHWKTLETLAQKRGEAGLSVIAACKTMANAGMEATDTIAKSAVSALSLSSTIMIAGLALSLVIGLGVAVFITRSITGPVTRVIQDLSNASSQLSSASGQVSTASQSLAAGASQQAASIEETSSSLEVMSSMTQQNADHATQADTLMKDANQVVSHANASMEEVTNSMQKISSASEETSKIIKTIDEIAFQTNLLALNAAVEAARAGEAGAGFAVVADEVRNLAMRAAEAAKTTASLIEGTVKKVEAGSELVLQTNEAFAKVAQSTRKVGELVAEISAASGEQAEGIGQINKAVTDMDQVVQQNAANAEESASASEQMNAQAEQLKSSVGDLTRLVGGSASLAANSPMEVPSLSHRPGPSRSLPPQPARSQKTMPMKKSTGEITPDDVIPLDDDFESF